MYLVRLAADRGPRPSRTNERLMQLGVGRLTGVFGIRGELKCKPTPLGEDAFAAGRTFAYRSPGGTGELRCTGARRHHERLLLRFEGIGDPESARAYVGAELFAERARVELGPGEYLDADLIGLRLIDEEGRELAQVVGVEHFPAQDCLVVGPQRALVPLVKAFVRHVDVAAGTIVMSLPVGLLE
jgi:16S rRNA processing protein RimM